MAYQHDSSSHRAGTLANARTLANGLGWFSLALGIAELTAARGLTRSLGMEGDEGLVRAYGVREIVKGIGILRSNDPTPWMWGRVAGDVLDIATLLTRHDDDIPKKSNVRLALAAVAGVTALDMLCARQLGAEKAQAARPVWDYSDRRGMPRPPEDMRGAARDFQVPSDMRTPKAMQPYPTG